MRFFSIGKTQAAALKTYLDKQGLKNLSLDELVKVTGSAQSAVALTEFQKRLDAAVAEE